VKALGMFPFPAPGAPQWLRDALERRLVASTTGECPCGAKNHAAPVGHTVQTIPLIHRDGCPAADSPQLKRAAQTDAVVHKFVVFDYPSGRIETIADSPEELRQKTTAK
jgi:hypothetical protein